nr:sugar phosphate isomerase/epimerase [Candidatus Sigynarchaeota archaeon]
MNENILACRIGSYGPFSLHSYEHLAEIGVKYIERSIPTSNDEVDMLKDILEEFKMKVSSFQVSFDPLNEKAFDAQIEDIMNANKEFGTSVMFTSLKVPESTGIAKIFNSKKHGKDDPRSKIFSQLRRMGDQIASRKVRVCLETHPNLVTNGRVGKETMEEINNENIRINFDTANMYYYNKDIDVIAELDLVLPYVGSVHLKDTNGKYKTWYFPALGEGIVNFPKVVEKLSGVGFHGPYTMEIEGIKGDNLTLDLVKTRVKNSVDYMRTIPGF